MKSIAQLPLILRPWAHLYAYTAAALIRAAHLVLFWTCRTTVIGEHYLEGRNNFIYCGWHEHTITYVATFATLDQPEVVVINPDWTISPISIFAKWYGADEVIPGAKGFNAIERTVELLRAGYSTNITPDGPRGPARHLRNGVLHIAREAKVPILPIRVKASPALILPWSWDLKYLPFPFSRITVEYFPPITVTEDNLDAARLQLIESLG